MTDYPKDGSTFIVESINRTAYRWAKYKADSEDCCWQKQVWNGDCYHWSNCEEPEGVIAAPLEAHDHKPDGTSYLSEAAIDYRIYYFESQIAFSQEDIERAWQDGVAWGRNDAQRRRADHA